MARSANRPALVIVGAWNPAILQPEWLAHQVLNHAAGEQVGLQMEFSPLPGRPARFTIDNLTFVPEPERLTIVPQAPDNAPEADGLNSAERAAQQILTTLPHTPLQAFGHNFEFVEGQPGEDVLEVFNLNEELEEKASFQYTSLSKTIVLSLQIEGCGCVLNFTRIFSNGSVTFKFNFHYEVSNSSDAIPQMYDSFARDYGIAVNLLNSYGITLEDDGEDNHA